LLIEEKYPEVQILFKVGKEKGYLLYEEVQTVLSDEVTGEPKDLEEVYTRFFDLGIEIVTDPDRASCHTGSHRIRRPRCSRDRRGFFLAVLIIRS